MALTSAINVLRCKETLRMSLTSAPKVLRCKGTLRMVLPSAPKVLRSKETPPYSQCAAADCAVAGIETPSSCKSTPGPTRQLGKCGGRQVRPQQAAKTLLALSEDMSQPQAN